MHAEHEHKFGLGDRVRVTSLGVTGEVIGLDCYGRSDAHYRVALDQTSARMLDQTWIYVEGSLEGIKNNDQSHIWIEWSESDGSTGSARWGSPVTDEQLDQITDFVKATLGRGADTVT